MEVRHSQLKNLLLRGYETKVPVDIKGAPGIGKSEIVKEVAERIAESEKKDFIFWNEINQEEKHKMLSVDLSKVFFFIDIRLAQFDQTDLKGFPNTKMDYAQWVPTLMFKVLSRPEATGMVFFDEMNLAAPSVTATAYQIVNDHQVGETPISKGMFFVSAGNRLEDTNNAFEDPAPLNNRRANVVLLQPQVRDADNKGDDWTTWATENNVDPREIAYLNWKESNLFKYDIESKDASFPTPRTWTKLSKMIEGVNDLKNLRAYAGALLGEGIAREFVGFLKLKEKVNIRNLLKNPKLIKKYSGGENIDVKYSIIAGVAELYVKDQKILNDALGLCKHLEPEFSMFMLKMMKGMAKGEFSSKLVKCKNWKGIAQDFAKYVL
jgi:hypothetical protein